MANTVNNTATQATATQAQAQGAPVQQPQQAVAQQVEFITIDGVPFTADQIKVMLGNKSAAPVQQVVTQPAPIQEEKEEEKAAEHSDLYNAAKTVGKVLLVGAGVAVVAAGGYTLFSKLTGSNEPHYVDSNDGGYDDLEI